jgi:hypothetical protein
MDRPKKPYRPPKVRSEKVRAPHMFATDIVPPPDTGDEPQPRP